MHALASARDWFDWSGWSFTVGGTLLSVLGLYATYREARAAKQRAREAGTAAQAARAAAEDTLRSLASQTTAGDLAFIRKDLEAVLVALETSRIPAALISVRASREALSRLQERLESTANRREIQRVVDDVAELQVSLERAVHEDGRIPRYSEVSILLSRHMDTLSRWSEQVRYKKVEGL
jgi:hypothetical protein